MEADQAESEPEDFFSVPGRLVISGVGLIGGSVALAARNVSPNCQIIGVGRNPERLSEAQANGLIDDFVTTPGDLQPLSNTLVVVCLPVELITEAVSDFARALGSDATLTDAGSVKGRICSGLSGCTSFVGAHPIAGGESAGFEHAEAGLFQDRLCIVTPEGADGRHVRRTQGFWKRIGCRVECMSPDRHDEILALTSHLPHVMAAATALSVPAALLPYTGTGFEDTTRIACGGAELWQQILCENDRMVIAGLDAAIDCLSRIREAVSIGDRQQLIRLLADAADIRRQLNVPAGSVHESENPESRTA